jgi:hypothetical protein
VSTEARPIKFVDIAPKNIRADEIVIESAKMGKLTAAVMVMNIESIIPKNGPNDPHKKTELSFDI